MTAPRNIPDRQPSLYDKLGGVLEGLLVRKFGLPQDDAKKVVAEAFLDYYSLVPPPEDVRAWLARTALDNAQTWLQRRRLPPGHEAEAAPKPTRPPSYRDAMAQLPAHAREALRLRFSEHKTPHQIAAELGVSPAEAEQIVTRAVAKMREVLRGKGR